jgi:cell wall-associated NlpC family hydrolase
VDCSGLVQQVYKSMGINLPRLSADQARAGVRTSLSKLRPGDLVAIDNSPRNNGADHIAIWAGNGYIIEAPKPGLNVRKRKIGPNETGWFGVHFAALG